MDIKKLQKRECLLSWPILESKGMCAIFQKKGKKKAKKKGKKVQNIWKFGQKCTKFENILKKGSWLRAIITCNKLLEKALIMDKFGQGYPAIPKFV